MPLAQSALQPHGCPALCVPAATGRHTPGVTFLHSPAAHAKPSQHSVWSVQLCGTLEAQ
jgi:hypothetical protein